MNVSLETQSEETRGSAGRATSRHTSAPRVDNVHMFNGEGGSLLLSVDRGAIYEIDDYVAEAIDRAMEFGDIDRVRLLMAGAGLDGTSLTPEAPPAAVSVRAFSLAVAQKCNLGCTYCYAQQGTFGGKARNMSWEVAKASVDRLLSDVTRGEKVSLAFLGGEPLVHRAVLRAATEYAAERAAAAGIGMSFSLTTNATLLNADDAEFFERFGFAVTVSIDGVGNTHDLLRPFKSGRGSYEEVVARARLLLGPAPRRRQVTARVTVTPHNLDLPETLEELVGLGFDGVQFSPLLKSPGGSHEMAAADFDTLLRQMIECGRVFQRRLVQGTIHPFLNVINTLRRIHHYQRDAYPCGAGGGYLGVSSAGGLYACHRFVDDDQGSMGTIADGIDPARQESWLSDRNVHNQEPCRSCWARYLCGGGCHHEAIYRGRPACDYIRGWLHYCLSLYADLVKLHPPLLGQVLTAPESSH